MMISEDFKEILNTYSSVQKEDFSTSTFQTDFKQKIPQKFSKLISDGFSVKASCGQENWSQNPWIILFSKNSKSLQEALVMEYRFDSQNSCVTLSMVPRLKSFEEFRNAKRLLHKLLMQRDTGDFKIIRDSFAVLRKDYSYDDLDEATLNNDLKVLTEIYNQLSLPFSQFLEGEDVICEINKLNESRILKEEVKIIKSSSASRKRKVFYSKGFAPEFSLSELKIPYIRKDKYDWSLKSPDELFTDENINKIIKSDIKIEDYRQILNEIKDSAEKCLEKAVKDHDIIIDDLSPKDRVMLIAKSFADVSYKSVGKALGSYAFGEIRVDDRLSNPLIITSIIHELSHFILESILKQLLMDVLKSNETPLISAYIKILLEDNDLNYLLDEYCAHTVEGRFALFGFQDYSSFNYKLKEISEMYSKEEIDYTLLVANTLAFDIKDILEEFIHENLREDIKKEFLMLPDSPDYEPLNQEIESRLEDNDLTDALGIVLTTGIAETIAQREKLERYQDRFEKI